MCFCQETLTTNNLWPLSYCLGTKIPSKYNDSKVFWTNTSMFTFFGHLQHKGAKYFTCTHQDQQKILSVCSWYPDRQSAICLLHHYDPLCSVRSCLRRCLQGSLYPRDVCKIWDPGSLFITAGAERCGALTFGRVGWEVKSNTNKVWLWSWHLWMEQGQRERERENGI